MQKKSYLCILRFLDSIHSILFWISEKKDQYNCNYLFAIVYNTIELFISRDGATIFTRITRAGTLLVTSGKFWVSRVTYSWNTCFPVKIWRRERNIMRGDENSHFFLEFTWVVMACMLINDDNIHYKRLLFSSTKNSFPCRYCYEIVCI